MDQTLVELALVLAKFSLLTVGDTSTVLGQMQQEVVGRGWLTDAQFLEAFTFSRVTPGPGSVIAVPIGYHAAGFAGALVAMVASYGPTAAVAFAVVDVWGRFRDRPWPRAFRTAMMPVTAGLIVGTTYTLLRASGDPRSFLVAAGAALLLMRTQLPTALVIGGGAGVGALMLRP
jgi:chromate transporter